MPPATHAVEDKLSFEPYDAVPGYESWVKFERALIKNGGVADDHGWSYADVFNGVDDGGALGIPLPPPPHANADARAHRTAAAQAPQGGAPLSREAHLQHHHYRQVVGAAAPW